MLDGVPGMLDGVPVMFDVHIRMSCSPSLYTTPFGGAPVASKYNVPFDSLP